MPCSTWQINLLRHTCHFIMKSSSVMLFLTSVFLVFFWETVVQMMNPTVLDWKQSIFISVRRLWNPEYILFQLTSQTRTTGKLRECHKNLPSWTVCYGKSPLLKNRLYQKRKKVLQFHKISLIVTVAPTADWKWNTSKPLQAVHWIETITCCQS